MLADKFNTTTSDVAIEFGTPVAERYHKIGNAIMFYLHAGFTPDFSQKHIDAITKFLEEGFDPIIHTVLSLPFKKKIS